MRCLFKSSADSTYFELKGLAGVNKEMYSHLNCLLDHGRLFIDLTEVPPSKFTKTVLLNCLEFGEQRGANKTYFAIGKKNEEWFKSYK